MDNRIIKFRAWNGLAMIHDVMVGKFGAFFVNPSNNGLDEHDSASLTPYNTKYSDTVPIMQFTGLQDLKGVDIYEGDIVYLAGYGNYEAKFPFIELYEASVESDIGAIIGNIHQNANLLNK